MREQLALMLELQDGMNQKVHPQWREQGFDWYRAIWIECAELLDHYGWKWWKHQPPDLEQVKLELIDIWHFGLSSLMEASTDDAALAAQLADDLAAGEARDDFRAAVEDFAAATLSQRRFHAPSFAHLLATQAIAFDDLFRAYVGKNVLNLFRQDHGYKQGHYRKSWGGREDNEHLVELAATLPSDSPDFRDVLYAALSERYQSLAD